MNTFQPPDPTATYAERVARSLTAAQGLTVEEICKATKLSDEMVRRGLDRLVFQRLVSVSFRHTAHRRGAMPREYWLAPPTNPEV